MAVLLLYNNENALNLYNELRKIGENVILFCERINLSKIKELKPSFIISYNYRYIIDEDVINYMNNKIVNLHISFLPWNRGANPNLWSFIDRTPKGVTIHQISKKIDRGGVLIQKEIEFDEKIETFATTYNRLNEEIVKLFMANWKAIKNGEIIPKEQIGEGTYHRTIDYLELKSKISFNWDDNIYEFKQRYNRLFKVADDKTE